MAALQYTGFTGATFSGSSLVDQAWAACPKLDELEFAEIRYESCNAHEDWQGAAEAMREIIQIKKERGLYDLKPKENW